MSERMLWRIAHGAHQKGLRSERYGPELQPQWISETQMVTVMEIVAPSGCVALSTAVARRA